MGAKLWPGWRVAGVVLAARMASGARRRMRAHYARGGAWRSSIKTPLAGWNGRQEAGRSSGRLKMIGREASSSGPRRQRLGGRKKHVWTKLYDREAVQEVISRHTDANIYRKVKIMPLVSYLYVVVVVVVVISSLVYVSESVVCLCGV